MPAMLVAVALRKASRAWPAPTTDHTPWLAAGLFIQLESRRAVGIGAQHLRADGIGASRRWPALAVERNIQHGCMYCFRGGAQVDGAIGQIQAEVQR